MFVDFKKAFDSIKRDVMFAILRHYGIPEKIICAIQAVYSDSKSAVFFNGKLSENFDVKSGGHACSFSFHYCRRLCSQRNRERTP